MFEDTCIYIAIYIQKLRTLGRAHYDTIFIINILPPTKVVIRQPS